MKRQYTVEERKNLDGSTYWIAITLDRSLLLDDRGVWVNLLSVDSRFAQFNSREELDKAIKKYEQGQVQ